MMAPRSTQRRLNVTPAFAQAAVPTMLWNAIPIMMDRIIGLNVDIPGSSLTPNAAPATIEFRTRPGRISTARRLNRRRAVAGMRAPSLRGPASSVFETKVMGWLHRFPTQYRGAQYINPTDNKCKINRFYELIGRSPGHVDIILRRVD